MRARKKFAGVLAVILTLGMIPVSVRAQNRAIDVSRSRMTIRVFKSGLFSMFAHDHEIEAPIESGTVELSPPQSVQLKFAARKLHVLDPRLAADKRAEVQKTMLGPEVLDSNRFQEISFTSTAVEKMGDAYWTVRGNLTLHGQTQPVVVEVSLKDGHYLGSAAFKQRTFGIEPVSVAGGTVKVKDEIKIEFDIVLK